ncbi:MAG TPA: Nramp family divalent metal transporter [Trebonia sp.]|nr:Nramp family divalent metal transporter [Trebonia sp.]
MSVDERVVAAAQEALSGERRGVRAVLPFLGPAFIASIAYIDPGNFATNMAGGAQFGYSLLWVVLAANLMATVVQALSAKLGIATGRSLPEICRERFPRPVVIGLWVQAEAVAMATDLAEFVGAAVGLQLVFGLSLGVSALLTAVAAFGVLALQVRGFRWLEAAITGLVGVVVVAFATETLKSSPSVAGVSRGLFVPGFSGDGAALLAASIVGATVMPHVIYLHSALTGNRIVGAHPTDRLKIFRFEVIDVGLAMGIAGAINLAMLATAAAVFSTRGLAGAGGDLGQVADGLNRYLGAHTGTIFGVALLASGIASSSVGTLSGQLVMEGFLRRRIPLFARRAVTMLPAVVLIAAGFNPTRALVLSQVFLSFGIAFALIPLVLFTRDRRIMGLLVNHRLTSWTAYLIAGVIIALNIYLLS